MPDDLPQQDEQEIPWDADDPRRQHDQMAPPAEPCECRCLHCGRTFMSDLMWFQKVKGARDGFEGFWMCPTANCGGAGFTFDIFPVDPDHPANAGWFYCDDDEGEFDDAEFDEIEADFLTGAEEPDMEYDPAEPNYQMLDQWQVQDDEDLEGEEWKFGLQPGERPPPQKPAWVIEEEKKYDEPDRRPRELDWTDVDRPEKGGGFNEDEIPF